MRGPWTLPEGMVFTGLLEQRGIGSAIAAGALSSTPLATRNEKRGYSVVVPLYNKGPFVERAIRSVLGQTYPDFEIVVIDDGSTDDGPVIVAGLQDNRVRLHRQLNSGVSVARNSGVLHARHDFVAFLDADDTWEPTFLTKLNELIDAFPDAGLYGINNWFRLANGKLEFDSYDSLFEGRDIGVIEDYFGLFAKLKRSPFSNSGCAFSKRVFLDAGGYKPGVNLTEDSDLWCRIALKYKIAFATTPLVTYYVETAGNTRTVFEPRDFQVSSTLQDALDQNLVPPRLKRSIRKLVALQQLRVVKRALVANDKIFARRKIMERRFLAVYPFQAILYMLVSIFPMSAVLWVHRFLKGRR